MQDNNGTQQLIIKHRRPAFQGKTNMMDPEISMYREYWLAALNFIVTPLYFSMDSGMKEMIVVLIFIGLNIYISN